MQQNNICELNKLTYEITMNQLPYVRAIINETLRLRAPSSNVIREVIEEKGVTLHFKKANQTITLPKGTFVSCIHGLFQFSYFTCFKLQQEVIQVNGKM